MWTPPRRRRLSARSLYSVGNVASSRLELQQLWSHLSVQSSPDRAVASAQPPAQVARAAPSADFDLGGPAVGVASVPPPLVAVADAAHTDGH